MLQNSGCCVPISAIYGKSLDVRPGTRLVVWRWLLIGCLGWIGLGVHQLVRQAQWSDTTLHNIDERLFQIERNTDPGSGDLARNGAR